MYGDFYFNLSLPKFKQRKHFKVEIKNATCLGENLHVVKICHKNVQGHLKVKMHTLKT